MMIHSNVNRSLMVIIFVGFVFSALLCSLLACGSGAENASQETANLALKAQKEINLRNSGEIAKYKKSIRFEKSVPPDTSELVKGNTDCALDLYRLLCEENGNLFFSPLSISSAIAMSYAGASNETARQMWETLHFTLPPDRLHPAFKALNEGLVSRGADGSNGEKDSKFRLLTANSMWGRTGYPFTKNYTTLLSEYYGIEPHPLDFLNAPKQSMRVINDWVSNSTDGAIKDIVPPGAITSQTVLVLAQAIYFESKWSSTFLTEATGDGLFTLPDGGHVTVPMMSQKWEFGYTEGDLFQAAELKYSRVDMSMVILLPRPGNFEAFERSLTPDLLRAIIDGFTWKTLILKLPKFTYTSNSLSLKNALISLGMSDAFSSAADFSGMDGTRDILISDVLHKASVTVNEEGTVASAGTVSTYFTGAAGENPIEFTVNRPFLFVIRDMRTGTLLFLGRILNPSG